jgi:hypothetical protein
MRMEFLRDRSDPSLRRPAADGGPWLTLRHFAVLLATAGAFAVSFVMLARVIGADSSWLGLLLMFYFLGLAKVAEPLYLLRLPPSIRALHASECSGALYRALGVPAFGALLRNTPLRWLNTSVYVAAASRDLARLQRVVEAGEAAHLYAAALFTPYIAWVAWRGHWREAAIFVVVQIAFNVYPILHLRSVRARLERSQQFHLCRSRS